MTSFAMIAGMVPMALGTGEGGEQTAPLGRAVIGGLIGATIATLLVLPAIFAMLQRKDARHTPSLYPVDAPAIGADRRWDADPQRQGNGEPDSKASARDEHAEEGK
jgi:hypothetical protein